MWSRKFFEDPERLRLWARLKRTLLSRPLSIFLPGLALPDELESLAKSYVTSPCLDVGGGDDRDDQDVTPEDGREISRAEQLGEAHGREPLSAPPHTPARLSHF